MTMQTPQEELGEALKLWLDQREETQQSALAAEWMDAWNKSHPDEAERSPETVRTQLNRCLNGKGAGIRFFFKSKNRGDLLVDLLGVPEERREELWEKVRAALQPDDLPSRLVVFVAGLLKTEAFLEELFAILYQWIKEDRVLFPATLVMTAQQHQSLTRRFEEVAGVVRWETFETKEEGWNFILEEAPEEALVISERPFVDYPRWAAAEFRRKNTSRRDAPAFELLLEPPEALERFASDGRLDELPDVAHPIPEEIPFQVSGLPRTAFEIRRWMRELTTTRVRAEQPSGVRRWLADRLGIKAAASLEELLEVEFPDGSPQQLERLLQQAGRKEIADRGLLVDGVPHLVNPSTEAWEVPSTRQLLEVHRIEPEPAAVSLLLEHTRGWTDVDWWMDPYLLDAIDELDPNRDRQVEFFNARANLFWNKAWTPAAMQHLPDWRLHLQQLLAEDPTQLRIQLPHNLVTQRSVDALKARGHDVPWHNVVPCGAKNRNAYYSHREEPGLRRLGEYNFSPDGVAHHPDLSTQQNKLTSLEDFVRLPPSPVCALAELDDRILVRDTRDAWEDAGVLLASNADSARSPELLIDMLDPEAWPSSNSPRRGTSVLSWNEHVRPLPKTKLTRAPLAPQFSPTQAHRLFATGILAARRAALSRETVTLPTGQTTVSLGGGWMADVSVGQTAKHHSPLWILHAGVAVDRKTVSFGGQAMPFSEQQITLTGAQLDPTLQIGGRTGYVSTNPDLLTLIRGNVVATLRFWFSPPLGGGFALTEAAASVHSLLVEEEEEAARNDG